MMFDPSNNVRVDLQLRLPLSTNSYCFLLPHWLCFALSNIIMEEFRYGAARTRPNSSKMSIAIWSSPNPHFSVLTTPRTDHSFAVKRILREKEKGAAVEASHPLLWPPPPMIGVLLLWGALNAYAKRKGIPVEELWQSSCACTGGEGGGGGDTVAVDDDDDEQQEQSVCHQERARDDPPQPASSNSASFPSFISSISISTECSLSS